MRRKYLFANNIVIRWNKLLRKFHRIFKRIKSIINSGNIFLQEFFRLAAKLNKLYQRLENLQGNIGLKLAGTSLVLMLSAVNSFGQSFSDAGFLYQKNALSAEYIAGKPTIEFVDIDGDGDLDIVSGSYCGRLTPLINDGGNFTVAPDLIAGTDTIDVGEFSAACFIDVDGDTDLDLLVGNKEGNIYYYRNDGSGNYTDIGKLQADGTDIDVGKTSRPTAADLDGDGIDELYVGSSYQGIYKFVNNGTGTFTSSGKLNGGGSQIGLDYSSPTFADIDDDGDLDLYVGDYYGNITSFENTGSGASGDFASGTTIISSIGYYVNLSPDFADIDDDGDLDLFVGNDNHKDKIKIYQNDGSGNLSAQGYVQADGNRKISLWYNVAPAFVDLDGDGAIELFAGNTNNIIHFEQNNLNIFTLVDSLKADGSYITPTSGFSGIRPEFADIDGDGDLDLYAGMYYDGIVEYLNDGSNNFNYSQNITSNGMYEQSPAIADVNCDGELDIVHAYGDIYVYENDGSNNFDTGSGDILYANCDTIDSHTSDPIFGDINNDGYLDLLLGNYDGTVSLLLNDGTGNLQDNGPIQIGGNNIDVGVYATIGLLDYDNDNDLDLVIGNQGGDFYLLKNLTTNPPQPITCTEFTTLPRPDIVDINDTTVCDTLILPTITGTNLSGNQAYYTGTDGTGTQYDVGDTITTSQTLYIYDNNGTCSDEEDYKITINHTPSFTVNNVTDCDSYTLPAIVGTNLSGSEAYYTETNAGGTPHAAGDIINSNTTLYVYDANGTCSNESSFDITINITPTVDDIIDQTVCDSYTLPAISGSDLSGTQSYYTGVGGTGTPYSTGTVINTDQTLYIYDANGSCSDEESFDITINYTPSFTVSNATACDTYILPTIVGADLSGSEAYYTETNAGGTPHAAGDIINSTTTLYVYDANGTCSNEETIDITIINTPILDAVLEQIVCDSYTLPAISGSDLSGTQSYYTGVGGTGTPYSAGTVVNTNQTLYIYDTNGSCSDEESFDITINQSPTYTLASNNPTTCSGTDGTITLSGLNANTDYLVSYNDGSVQGPVTLTTDASGNIDISGLNAGSYTDFTVELNSCPTIDNSTINLSDPNAPSINAGQDDTICIGEGVTLTATNPDGANISWSPTITDGQEFFPTDTVTYTVTADLSGCISSDQVTINVNPIPQVVAGIDQTICEGQGVTLTATNPDGANISWSPTITDGQEFFPTDTTIYTVTADLGGCFSSDQVAVNVKPTPQIEAGQDTTICEGQGVTLTAINPDGANISWSPTITDGQEFFPTDTTTYVVTADLDACTSSDQVTINVNTTPQIEAGQDQTVCENEQVTLTATNPDGASILWTPIITDGVAFTQNVGAQMYYVVGNLNNCSATDSVTVTVNANPVITTSYSDFCEGTSTNIGVNETYDQYIWTFNSSTISSSQTVDVSESGTYYVTVTENNCTTNDSITINEIPATSINIANTDSVTCFGFADGVLNADIVFNTVNYSVYITNGNDTIYDVSNIANDININLSNLDIGTYIITTVNDIGCESSETFTIEQAEILSINQTTSDISCYGFADGSITLNTSGGTLPYTYAWNGTSGQETVTNLNAGAYSVTVTDAHNCNISVTQIDIQQPDSLMINELSLTHVQCFGDEDGSIQINIEGGVSNYSVSWSNGDNTEIINNLEADNYTVTVTDNNNCVQIQSFDILEPSQIQINDSIYYLNSLGNIDISAFGGTGNYDYLWSNGIITANNNNLFGGEYTITITDENSCKAYSTFTIDIPLLIPTVITPNADGFNDTWHIQGIEAYSDIEIHIFNRWGDLLYEFSGGGLEYSQTSVEWDGIWNGKELPLGTYVYILVVKDNNEKYNGTVTIVR